MTLERKEGRVEMYRRGIYTITIRAVGLVGDLGHGDAGEDCESGDELHDDDGFSEKEDPREEEVKD